MDYALIGRIARLTDTRPNWDRDVTRAVGAARVCAIAALIWALGAEVEYADLRGIELFQAKPELPDRPRRRAAGRDRAAPGGRDDPRRRACRAGARPARLEAAARGRATAGARPVPGRLRRGARGHPQLAAAASLDGGLGDGARQAP